MPNFRARRQKSGVVYYYFDTGAKPRKEIPLGKDYREAVKKWLELSAQPVQVACPTFADLADRYLNEVTAEKAKSTQETERSSIKRLREFFCNPTPAPLNAIKPKHVHQLLEWAKDTPTTANRLKRVFSHMFNMGRAWGWTEAENPCLGVRGHSLDKREVYISDDVFRAVYEHADAPLRDAMDLAYLTGQRPGDALKLTERNIKEGCLVFKQGKTSAPIRMTIEGELAALLQRIEERKDKHSIYTSSLLINKFGKPMTKVMLRHAFEDTRAAAAEANPDMAEEIKAFWFYDLRAKAADDVADVRGEAAAAAQLGHASVKTTKRHYLRRGTKVQPTK